jgi:hypothetical protein
MTSVVELKRRKPTAEVQAMARFVLMTGGTVKLVELAPGGERLARELTRHGIPGPGDGMLTLSDGLEFLTYLHEAFRGSRLWATPVFEMKLDQALGGHESPADQAV